ncbi:uncharacterized protein LOC119652200 [Hermetia illucens]|uniref:uncharacterized protein LOC119652200 n=1 Tax=Hermetia illucens TaxID=343691 RepID=UPI0018CC5DF2|nr:uncharacterized protein LOC119652200 [Hermetia illucens]
MGELRSLARQGEDYEGSGCRTVCAVYERVRGGRGCLGRMFGGIPSKYCRLHSCGQQSTSSSSRGSRCRLERIKIPSYGGDYTQWAAFHDLFKVMVHDNNKLNGVQKLQYLRASVNGEAEQLIRHLTLTENNYAAAWKFLKEGYDNKRAIGNAYMKGIWSLPTSTPASAICHKRILDTTEQFRANTESLGADLVDLIMVYILQQKLDTESNSEWQKFIGSSNEIPTLEQFTTFLYQRFTILEAVQITQRKTVRVGAHSVQAAGAVCRVCQVDHRISQCDTFFNSDIAKRGELVASLRLCYNCLHEAHPARNCPSRKRCKQCGKKA